MPCLPNALFAQEHLMLLRKAIYSRSSFPIQNDPMLVKVLPKLEKNRHKTLPAVGKFLDLSAENLVLMAFKQSEDDSNVWILRCYECRGEEAKLELKSDLGLAISHPVDLLEQPINLPQKSDDGRSFRISPWKIASLAVNLS